MGYFQQIVGYFRVKWPIGSTWLSRQTGLISVVCQVLRLRVPIPDGGGKRPCVQPDHPREKCHIYKAGIHVNFFLTL